MSFAPLSPNKRKESMSTNGSGSLLSSSKGKGKAVEGDGFEKVISREEKRKQRKVDKQRPQFQFDISYFRMGKKIGIAVSPRSTSCDSDDQLNLSTAYTRPCPVHRCGWPQTRMDCSRGDSCLALRVAYADTYSIKLRSPIP